MIREFDGLTDVEAFIDRIRNVRDQLNPTAERIYSALLRKIIAAK